MAEGKADGSPQQYIREKAHPPRETSMRHLEAYSLINRSLNDRGTGSHTDLTPDGDTFEFQGPDIGTIETVGNLPTQASSPYVYRLVVYVQHQVLFDVLEYQTRD